LDKFFQDISQHNNIQYNITINIHSAKIKLLKQFKQ